MKEEFLHYLWQYKMFSSQKLKTVNNKEIIIVKSGISNKNSGPDFLNVHLKIDNQLWVGNVEIHVKSSDWYLHQHENDKNYDAVILHVVWQDDAPIFMKNNQPLPTLELQNFVDKKLLQNYNQLFSLKRSWIPCENQITNVGTFLVANWLERLYFERLEQKTNFIKYLLLKSNNNFEAVLFLLMAKNFGLKVNGEAFLQLASSFDFSELRKVRFNEQKLAALLFGQAGFLSDDTQNLYQQTLLKEYEYLKHKYKLTPILKNQFQFFRMRPSNFPTIRIAQLIALYHKYQNLFSKLMAIENLNDFYKLFSVEVNDFWKTHYTFKTVSKKSSKKLTKSFIDLLLINSIIPLKFYYLKSRGEIDEQNFLSLIQQIKPEKNSIISRFLDLNIKATNAFETQALLQLKTNYCNVKNCLNCQIGNQLLRKN